MASRKKNESTQHNDDVDAEIAAKIKLDEGSLHYNLQNRQDFIVIKQITIRLAVRGLFEPLARNAPQTYTQQKTVIFKLGSRFNMNGAGISLFRLPTHTNTQHIESSFLIRYCLILAYSPQSVCIDEN